MPDISVIICTHNPRPNYLIQVLDALKTQSLSKEQWELLLIDNRSKEILASAWDLSWHPHARHIRENELGLTSARLRGIAESTCELLVFVDDDNILETDYLRQALGVSRGFPQLGVWGGTITGIFEVNPSSALRSRLGMLAVGEIANDAWGTIKGFNEACPPGAGIVVRKNICEKYFDQVVHNPLRLLLGRKGQALTSGEDVDLAWFSCECGYGMGRFKRLHLRHLIPAQRLTVEYFERLVHGAAYSNIFLHYCHNMPLPEPPNTLWSKLRRIKQRMLAGDVERRLSVAAWQGVHEGLADLKDFQAGRKNGG